MPVHRSSDVRGSYYQYGSSGKKYYIKEHGEKGARDKADKQAEAIHASGFNEPVKKVKREKIIYI